jgi:hypothetical protein
MHFASSLCRLGAKLPSRYEMSDAAAARNARALRRSGLDPRSGPAHERTQEVARSTVRIPRTIERGRELPEPSVYLPLDEGCRTLAVYCSCAARSRGLVIKVTRPGRSRAILTPPIRSGEPLCRV